MTAVKRIFQVDGKPFFPIGGQACNSSGYNAAEAEQAFNITKMVNGNTLEIPVYWEQVEPKEGKFDFTAVDELLAGARRYEMKLILLWFASWKNGNMDYTPKWVKTDTKRFKRVKAESGKDVWDLSSHCKANQEADKKAFVALCKHLKAKDGTDRTVIAVQIENEQGIIGSDRDYGPEAQAEFDSPVPAKLVAAMKKAGCGRIYDIWQQSGAKKSGTWPEIFGWQAGELMTAWSIASYVDNIAAAAKAAYDIVLYTNVWLMEQHGWVRAGESYPSGGGVSKVLDIYKWYTPHLDFIAPDNYELDAKGFAEVCANYAREDNPFFMPETIGDPNMFRAIADYNCLGNFFFGVEVLCTPEGEIRPERQTTIDCIRCTAAAAPLLLKYQGTGKIHTFIQEDNVPTWEKEIEGFSLLVEYGDKRTPWSGKDWRHRSPSWMPVPQAKFKAAYAWVIQAARNEFYLVGANCRFYLRPQPTLETIGSSITGGDSFTQNFSFIVSVDEGHIDKNGEFVVDRKRNGDEIGRRGFWVEPDIKVLRVITCD
jgi:Beta-galactosidase.